MRHKGYLKIFKKQLDLFCHGFVELNVTYELHEKKFERHLQLFSFYNPTVSLLTSCTECEKCSEF